MQRKGKEADHADAVCMSNGVFGVGGGGRDEKV